MISFYRLSCLIMKSLIDPAFTSLGFKKAWKKVLHFRSFLSRFDRLQVDRLKTNAKFLQKTTWADRVNLLIRFIWFLNLIAKRFQSFVNIFISWNGIFRRDLSFAGSSLMCGVSVVICETVSASLISVIFKSGFCFSRCRLIMLFNSKFDSFPEHFDL